MSRPISALKFCIHFCEVPPDILLEKKPHRSTEEKGPHSSFSIFPNSSFSIFHHFLPNYGRILPALTFNGRHKLNVNLGRILPWFGRKCRIVFSIVVFMSNQARLCNEPKPCFPCWLLFTFFFEWRVFFSKCDEIRNKTKAPQRQPLNSKFNSITDIRVFFNGGIITHALNTGRVRLIRTRLIRSST